MDPQIKQTIQQAPPNGVQQVSQQTCKYCNNSIPPNVFYCPVCGKKLKEPPVSTKLSKQLSVYAISIFLPPLGIIPAIKYLVSNEKHAKMVGLIALILTLVSTLVTIYYSIGLFNQINNQVNGQFNDLQNLGY